jgi:tyrosyl-tRNA synthetase
MYGKVMSVPDQAMRIYHKLVLGWNEAQLEVLDRRMAADPMGAKKALAHEIVRIFMGEEAADQAAQHFSAVFQKDQLPEDMPDHVINVTTRIVDILSEAGLTSSKNDARRQITGGAVRLNGAKVDDFDAVIAPENLPIVLQVGKRRFVRVVGG